MKILAGYLTEEYLTHDRNRFEVNYIPQDRSGRLFPLSISEMLAQCPNGWKPDVFLHPGIGHFPLPSDLEEFSGLTVCAAGDWDRRGRATRAGVGFFDLPVGPRNLLPLLDPADYAGTEFARLWYAEPEKHTVLPGVERDLDILFVGSINPLVWPEREKWLERIALLSDRHRVRIENGVFGEEYVRLLNRAKIVFNCSVDGATNARVYEAAACGALLFNEAGNVENAEILEDGVHHVTYSLENYRERLAYYLNHEAERASIAEAGRKRIIGEHTLRHHTDALFVTMKAYLGKRGRPALQWPRWVQAYRKAQQVYGCSSLPYAVYCRRLLKDASREGCPPGLFHEAQAALFSWEASEGGLPELMGAAAEQAARAFAEMPENLFVRMTFAGTRPLQQNGILEAKRVLKETLERCKALLSGELEFDFSMIEGFGYPRWLDGFDFEIGRAEMRLPMEAERSVQTILQTFGWRCGAMLFDLALYEHNRGEAIQSGKLALELKPDAFLFALRLADCLSASGDWKAAAQHYETIWEVPFSFEHWLPAIHAFRNAGAENRANAFLEQRLNLIDVMPSLSGMKAGLLELRQ